METLRLGTFFWLQVLHLFKTVMALIRDKAKIGLKSGVYSSSRAQVRSSSWAGLSRQIGGLVYTCIGVIFPTQDRVEG